MVSTFMGLEIAKRGLTTQQAALYTTGQNVSNANTPGYTRERVNLQATDPYPSVGMNAPAIPGQMGTGVEAGSIQRIRDSFLDVQYRNQNNQLGYWQARSDSLDQLQNIMNEPSDSGLANTMDQFWSSLQDLAADPTNSGARSVVRERGQAVAYTFNYLSTQLSTVQNQQKNQIDVTVQQVNSLTNQLNSLNQQIGNVEQSGYLPNDLYDQRDQLIDQLSSLVNIKVDYVQSGGNAKPQAEGKAVISLVDDNGSAKGLLLSDTANNQLSVSYGGPNQSVDKVSLDGNSYDFSTLNSSGKLKSLIESYGYDNNGSETGTYPDMLTQLDNLAYTFATNFNSQHEAGMSPNEIAAKQNQNIPFFADTNSTDITNRVGFASRIQLSQQIQDSLDNIATADGSDPANATLGDSTNVKALAGIINQNYDYGQNQQQANFQSYYQNVIGGMGVQAQEATTMATNTTNLQQSVDQQRKSVSSVSIDEEMTNMIQYQQAYNASAKMITMQDDLLNTIINGMGVTR